MKQTQKILSTYTADVSGVCSALFELGGMTVMHDASGCNSTYNTHDEPRWYDYDSLVFISGLSEMEAIMGDDEKLIHDITDAANQLHPAFIAIAGTPIPMMIGCDIPAVARAIEARTSIPCFGFQTNGMHSYVQGAGMALAAYARRMTDGGAKKTPRSMNILGATPLDFSVNGCVEDMEKLMGVAGWAVISTWAMGSSPDRLFRAGEAEVNLVVSAVGLPVAKALKEKFGTPYVVGTPTGAKFSERILATLHATAADGNERRVFDDFRPEKDAELIIIGESVCSRSLAAAIELEYGKSARVLCPVETEKGILSENDLLIEDEQDMEAAIISAKTVIADPLYKPIVPPACSFFDLPSEAFSGRLYRKSIPNLVRKI